MEIAFYKPTDFQWSQRDLRWSWKKLGASGLDVGHYGCASIAVNYAVNRAWQKKGINRFSRPGEFVDWCNIHGKYTRTGQIYWNSADSFSGGVLVNTWKKSEAWITLQEVVWGQYHHWLVLLDGDLCLNPWTGHIEKRNQSIWYPSGRYQYFKLV